MEDFVINRGILTAAVLFLNTIGSTLLADPPPTGVLQIGSHFINQALLATGTTVYERMKQQYPDSPNTAQEEVPPHAVGVFLSGVEGNPSLDLVMPFKAWNDLSAADRRALVEYLRDQVQKVQKDSDPYTHMSPSAPVYLAYKEEQQSIKDNAWRIRVGHMDEDNYLVPDKTVLAGSDYSESSHDVPVFTDADPKVDPVYGSKWDGSVQQVKDYLSKNLNDPDSVKYVSWTRVLKTGVGYQVTVTYRAKNGFGAYILTDQTFTLNGAGVVNDVKSNGKN